MKTHCINGNYTDRNVEYLIGTNNSIVIASDLCAPGYWDNTEFDLHIQQCISRFIIFATAQPVFLQVLKNNGLWCYVSNEAQIHPTLLNWCDENHITCHKRDYQEFNHNNHTLMAHAFVFGIHSELCVTNYICSIISSSKYTTAVYLDGCMVPLVDQAASFSLQFSRYTPRVDLLQSTNCTIIE